MKKLLLTIGGIVFIGIAYWLISPLFITERVSESIEELMPPAATPAKNTPEVAAQGAFTGLGGHNSRGMAKLLAIGGRRYIRFEDDFRVTNGPDLFVYLGKNGAYAPEARLAALKGNEGGQNYEIPAGIDTAAYDEVWIWCRAFSVPFAKAELR